MNKATILEHALGHKSWRALLLGACVYVANSVDGLESQIEALNMVQQQQYQLLWQIVQNERAQPYMPTPSRMSREPALPSSTDDSFMQ